MNSVKFMEKLLDGVKVEWKPLGEIGEFVRGNGLQKSDFAESGVGCIHYGQIYTFYGNFAYQTKSFVSPTLATKLRKAQKGDLIIATTSENIEDVCKPLVWLGEDEVCVSGETYIFKHNQNPKFLAYYLQTPMFFEYKKRNQTGTKVIRVHGDKLAEFQIPIPPLKIQAEIVRILDAFTELTAELTAELTSRKKQYTYYRDQLLTFEDGQVEWKTLGEVCSIGVGQAPKSNEIGDYSFVNAGTTPSGYLSEYNTEPNTITTPSRGQGGIGYVGYQASRFWCGPLCYRIRSISEKISTRFLYYVMSNSMIKIIGLANMTGVPALNRKELVEFSVPIPSSAEQERIVDILDKFDALTNSITDGLPREIRLRQKQYEYYRNLLLTFTKNEVGLSYGRITN